MNASLFANHIAGLITNYENALSRAQASGGTGESVLLHSGSEHTYFGDDRHVVFQSFGHLNHWLPVNRPEQFIWFTPGARPVYFQVIPDDFWYEQTVANEDWWADEFEIVRVNDVSKVKAQLDGKKCYYLGENTALAAEWGVPAERCNPTDLLAYLDFQRAIKSSYELEQLRAASRLGVQGHAAARRAFLQGGNEYDIHLAFLTACNILEEESPYTNIVALDEKAAILHYQHKRRTSGADSQVLLIDAGCRVNRYGSDITRTWTKDSAHPVFKSLVDGMIALELSLVDSLTPGKPYRDLQTLALRGVANLLIEHEICSGTADALVEQNIPQWFMPHGVGHLLGIQVHDVGGHQLDESGTKLPPPPESPSLRNTRIMAENMVFTVEPGLYFIPMILETKRDEEAGKCLNWSLINALYPFGGIRIEDNVRVMNDVAENLTRQFEQPAP